MSFYKEGVVWGTALRTLKSSISTLQSKTLFLSLIMDCHLLIIVSLVCCINIGTIFLIIFHTQALVKSLELTSLQFWYVISVLNLLAYMFTLRIWITFKSRNPSARNILAVKYGMQLMCITCAAVSLFYMFAEWSRGVLIIGFIFETMSFVLEIREHIKNSNVRTRETRSPSSSTMWSRSVVPIVTLHATPHVCTTGTDCTQCPCPVCLEPVTEYVELECKHTLCTECARKLVAVSNKCPCCRNMFCMSPGRVEIISAHSSEEPSSELPSEVSQDV